MRRQFRVRIPILDPQPAPVGQHGASSRHRYSTSNGLLGKTPTAAKTAAASVTVTRGIMVGGLFLSLGRPTQQQQKACIARSGGFNYDPKFHGASSPLRSSLGDDVAVEEQALSQERVFVNPAPVLLGAGPRTFDLARSALLSWKYTRCFPPSPVPILLSSDCCYARRCRHFELGWTFVDPETPVEKGARFCVCVKEVIPWLMMPLQIAYVRDEISGRGPTKASFGFGSGTLQGHLLAGEERFSVERDENDKVWYEIYSFSKPAHFLSMQRAVGE
ncbi:hypothetical protein MUK42_22825 [Musa troglodytarum]|uniref:DUF1990 domain-containing protein n=1 Tax=Musa troglodytarum TaxID=320322 RepID=A0A9E7HPM7_9LILI|nr:hypothetical protein MUK42_22825 [Musa troglodytarum]